jgi:hypothetical protein
LVLSYVFAHKFPKDIWYWRQGRIVEWPVLNVQ